MFSNTHILSSANQMAFIIMCLVEVFFVKQLIEIKCKLWSSSKCCQFNET